MATELELRYLINLAGNIFDRTAQYTRAFAGMEQRTTQSLSKMQRAVQVTGAGIDRLGNRYTAFITGAIGAEAVRSTITMEERMERLGNSANLSAEKIELVKKQIFDIASKKDISIPIDDLAAAFEAMFASTKDAKFAEDNLESMAMLISATGISSDTVGNLSLGMKKLGITTKDDVLSGMNMMNEMAKVGALSMDQLSEGVAESASSYAGLGRTGPQALRELSAALSVIASGTRDKGMAAQVFNQMLGSITDPAKRRMLQNAGINVFDPEQLKKGKQVLRPINQIMTEMIEKSKGLRTQLALIFDERAIQGMNAMEDEFQRTGSAGSINKMMDVQAKQDSLLEDSRRHADTAAAAITKLHNSWDKFADDNLTQPIESLADAVNNLKPDQLQEYYTWIKLIGIAFGALWLAKKAAGFVGGVINFAQGYKNGGWAGALGSMGSGGGTPVYVTNMPKGLLGETTTGINDALGYNPNPKTSWGKIRDYALPGMEGGAGMKDILRMGSKGLLLAGGYTAAAGVAGYAAGSYWRDHTDSGMAVEDAIGHGFAKIAAVFGSKEAQDAIASRNQYEQQRSGLLRIELTSKDGSKATVQKLDAPTGTDLDVGNTTHFH